LPLWVTWWGMPGKTARAMRAMGARCHAAWVRAIECTVTVIRGVAIVSLFLSNFAFDGEKCSITLGNLSGELEEIQFSFVRTYLFFKESDFYPEIGRYEKSVLSRLDGSPSSVFQILKNPIIENVLQGRFREENPMYFGIWTPDECLEIVASERPVIKY
jgi:hypothetical protein